MNRMPYLLFSLILIATACNREKDGKVQAGPPNISNLSENPPGKGPEEDVPDYVNEILYVGNFNTEKVFVYENSGYKKLNKEYLPAKNLLALIPVNNKIYITNYGDNPVSVIKK